MLSADSAQVNWDTQKKRWSVRVKIRGGDHPEADSGDSPRRRGREVLRSAAVETAKADGYQVDPAKVDIAH